MELIPTGEIIRVVHPHRPCKLVSGADTYPQALQTSKLGWSGLGGRRECLPSAQKPLSSKLLGEEVSSGEAFGSLVGCEGIGQEGTRRGKWKEGGWV